MNRHFTCITLALVFAVLLSACQGVSLSGNSNELKASGTISATKVKVAAELGGRVVEVLVKEGQTVAAGQALVKLDDAAMQAQAAQAQAGLQAAQANYDLLAAGATAEQLRQAQAALNAAQARLDGIKAGPRAEQVTQSEANLSIAKARLAALERGGRPEQVAQAEANLASAQARLTQVRKGATEQDVTLAKLAIDQAKNSLWSAQAIRDGTCGNKSLSTAQCDGAKAQVLSAETGVQQAETRLAQLQAGAVPEVIAQAEEAVRGAAAQLKLAQQPASSEDLAQARDAVRLAEAQLALVKQPVTSYDIQAAEAQVESTRAQIDALKAGARTQQLAAAQAQVAQAQAQVQSIEVQLRKVTLVAPVDGVILARSIEPGEIASPGATLLVVGKLSTLELTVYLAEEKFALVSPGEQALVHVDAYPQHTFTATVLRIADQAEFTPRNVQTVEGRRATVFAVKLLVPNPDLKLKPGMPADVVFP